MSRILTIAAPSAFEAGQIRSGLVDAAAAARVVQVGVGPGADFGARWSRALRPGDAVILAGVAGALDSSCRGGCAYWADAVVDEEGRRWIPPVSGLASAMLAGRDRVISTPPLRRAEHERTGACMVDCESSSFARIASARGWRWGVLRGISDGADDTLPSWMPQLLRRDGSIDAGAIAGALMGRPLRALDLVRSGIAAGRAMRAVNERLAEFLGEPPETRGARRVLLFGGTFDPPHRRHVSMACAAASLLDCDRIVVMPAGRSPLRRGVETASPELRLEMARAAFAHEPRAFVSDLEMRRGGTSYTVDTLIALGAGSRRAREDTVLLIGSDQALQFDRWRDSSRIAGELAAPAVVLRPPDTAESFAARCAAAGGESDAWTARLLPVHPVELSATAIRAALVRGDDPRAVPGLAPAVADIIARSGAYRTPTMAS